ncbi:MAG: hypothetical protein HRU29_09785 [Rhizobiales bacterium]|nr:hypothetical protein [Hyphomicrobiales bacterium]
MTRTRKNLKTCLLSLVLPWVMIAPANAELLGSKISLIGGTLGMGAEYSIDLLETFSLKASAQAAALAYDFTAFNTDYKATADLKSIGVQADFTPFGGGIYATSGVFYNMNEFQLKTETNHSGAGGSGPLIINSISDVTFAPISPYLGAGFKLGLLGFLDFSVEAGVMSHGVPNVTTELTEANNILIPSVVEDEVVDKIRANVETFTLYPVIKIAASINF